MAETDDAVLDIVEGEMLGTSFIDELLALVDRGQADDTVRLTAERDRPRAEVARLLGSLAAGVPAESVAPAIREREVAALDARLAAPRPEQPDLDRLRAALTQRAETWRHDLRAEPKLARLLLRRLVGPMTLWEDRAGVEWTAEAKPALLDGLVRSFLRHR